LRDKINHCLLVKVGQSDASGGSVQAGHVSVGTEETDVALLVLVCLHAFEALKGVVEDTSSRVEREVLVGGDTRCLPAVGRCPFERQHVVGKVFAKDQLIIGDQFLGGGRLGDGQLGVVKGGQFGVQDVVCTHGIATRLGAIDQTEGAGRRPCRPETKRRQHVDVWKERRTSGKSDMDPIAMSQDYLAATDGICGQGAGERPEASKTAVIGVVPTLSLYSAWTSLYPEFRVLAYCHRMCNWAPAFAAESFAPSFLSVLAAALEASPAIRLSSMES
jgi:hypothetical protein